MSHQPTDELGNRLHIGDLAHFILKERGILTQVASIDEDKGIVMLMVQIPIIYTAEHRRISGLLAVKMPEESTLITMPSMSLVQQ